MNRNRSEPKQTQKYRGVTCPEGTHHLLEFEDPGSCGRMARPSIGKCGERPVSPSTQTSGTFNERRRLEHEDRHPSDPGKPSSVLVGDP